MTPPQPLDQVQRWMLSVITDPRGIEAGIGSDAARQQIPVAAADVEQVIERSAACTSLERLAVYGNAYFARLLECLTAEYEVVCHAAGEEPFQSLAAGYIQAYPSTSYTLGQLGAKFPEYLEETRPARDEADAGPDWADFLIDLARLERTYSEVFDGPGEEGGLLLDATALQTIPSDQWGCLRLRLTESLRLLTLRFPVHETYTNIRQGREFSPPSPREVTLAVYRQNYIVQRRELLPEQATLLAAIQRGESLDRALNEMVTTHEIDPPSIARHLGDWFETWTARGIVTAVETSVA